MSAVAEGEDYAPPGRARGGEKLAEWEIKAARWALVSVAVIEQPH
jgi:hypothetical protein